jgi:hypothetical protein
MRGTNCTNRHSHVYKTWVNIKTQPIKPVRIHVQYPYIICSNVEHRSRTCPRNVEVQNMFKTKHVSFNATTTFKLPKFDNVPINVVFVVTIRNQ